MKIQVSQAASRRKYEDARQEDFAPFNACGLLVNREAR